MSVTSLMLLLACQTSAVQDPAPADGQTTAWEPDVSQSDEPLPSAAEAEQALAHILPQLLGLNSLDIMGLYAEHMAMEGGGCPETELAWDPETQVHSRSWYGYGCVTPEGVRFDGYAFDRSFEQRPEADGLRYTGGDFKGDVLITRADGSVFGLGGFAYSNVANDPWGEELVWNSGLQGSIFWTGAPLETSWIDTGVSAELTIEVDATGEGLVVLAAGFATGLGGPIPTFSTQGLVVVDPALGCPELGGVVALRDAEGRWLQVSFDGPTWIGDALGDCDGCGVLSFEGEALGAVCADPSLLMPADGAAPW